MTAEVTTLRSGITLPVNEVYGPVWQGEGPYTGRRCGFLRLGGCNLTCEWCDTPYTWDPTRYDLARENPEMDVVTLTAAVLAIPVPLMILTGGEPLLHAKREPSCPLAVLLAATATDKVWHVETNGTIPPPPWLMTYVQHVTVSPKINTADPEHRRLNRRALAEWAAIADTGRAAFKFVASTPEDLDTIHSLCESLGITPHQVWIQAEGTDAATLIQRQRDLAPHIHDHGWHLTTRLHVLLYDDDRGV